MTLRDLPSVDELLRQLEIDGLPHNFVVRIVRRVLDEARAEIRAGREPRPLEAAAREALQVRSPLRRVINATGVILHTNLGRAPIAPGGYSNLEYDVASGTRGRRDIHVSGLLEALLGAPGIVLNNNAAAVFLVLHELAAGFEVVVSRGELIEIGDGFRIPEIMARSGALIREVGTTNRTRIGDYRNAISERTRLILRVHPGNFRIQGFTARPELRDLAALARERQIPLYEDLGSGCLVDLRPFGIDEPLVRDSLDAGVDLVSFSGDKLLGGPQAGIIAGKAELVQRVRRNPLFRAFRAGKTVYAPLAATLEATLRERWNEVPALRMIMAPVQEIRRRAERVARETGGVVISGESVIGGGSTPQQSLPTWLVAYEGDVVRRQERLRASDPPVIARVSDDRLLIDLRTVSENEEAELIQALR
ncbi:MAG TPA: L-seryl-tRNA(Sec) selenium transferase [Bryobacteraceae bacterium]|nr:L-seryl-tRNA(Sec) selenium transferase [Bryobacteraceae bacterium]